MNLKKNNALIRSNCQLPLISGMMTCCSHVHTDSDTRSHLGAAQHNRRVLAADQLYRIKILLTGTAKGLGPAKR